MMNSHLTPIGFNTFLRTSVIAIMNHYIQCWFTVKPEKKEFLSPCVKMD